MNFVIFAATLLLATPALAAPAPSPAPIEVMFVGGFHMSNPGHDIHDMQVPDILVPKFQAQIRAVDDALARFKPTLVAAEWDAETVAERYPKFLNGVLPPSHNEVVQLGFRLAKQSGAAMHGVDVDGDFPFGPVQDYAKVHGETAILDAAGAELQTQVDIETRLVNTEGIASVLRYLNDPARLKGDNAFYRDLLKVGGGKDQPGADLLTAWNKRNFLICANLIQLAKPGDRMVVFYGSGHAFLLRQCVAETPGFKLVEANDYLPK
jgi:hypothetical protein